MTWHRFLKSWPTFLLLCDQLGRSLGFSGSSRCMSTSKRRVTMPICKRRMTPSVTCCTLRAHERGITCLS